MKEPLIACASYALTREHSNLAGHIWVTAEMIKTEDTAVSFRSGNSDRRKMEIDMVNLPACTASLRGIPVAEVGRMQ